MREIKFRAWDTKNNRMIQHGELVKDTLNKGYILIDAIGGHRELTMTAKPFYELMQYTGLKDKNGKEIYEGDIVSNRYHRLHQIGFDRGMFTMIDILTGYGNTGIWNVNHELKVIGNIYENPKLSKRT